MKTIKSLALCALLAASVVKPLDDTTILGAALGVGLAAAAATAGYLAYTYEEPTQALINRAQNLINEADRYEHDIYIIKARMNIHNPQTATEESLYEITSLLTKDSGYYYYSSKLSSISSLLQNLRKIRTDINQRIFKIAEGKISEMYSVKEVLQNHLSTIELRINTINSLYNFVYEHRTYMDLFESEVAIYKKYDKSLKILETEGSNPYSATKITHVLTADYHHNLYPYIEAATTLESKISSFKNKLNNANSYRYPQRTAWGHWLLERLEAIETILKSSPDLQRDKMRKEQDEIAQERKKLEKERERVEYERKRIERERRKAERAADELRDATREAKKATKDRWN